jgi:hypothetical protein
MAREQGTGELDGICSPQPMLARQHGCPFQDGIVQLHYINRTLSVSIQSSEHSIYLIWCDARSAPPSNDGGGNFHAR